VPALFEASRTAASQDTKYIVTKLQLRGKSGSIIATDTRQLLVQGGYEFPFKDDVLLPRCEVFGLQPLHTYEDVGIGRTDTHVAIPRQLDRPWSPYGELHARYVQTLTDVREGLASVRRKSRCFMGVPLA
jgi:hypothetical protein